jgi:hypothetical protein
MNGNPSCQHYHIDNDTWRCVACLSAPNAAPCRDPNHLAAIEAGEDFECWHPYVPDVRRQKTVVIGWDFTYGCERCGNSGTLMNSRGVTWECGKVHRGQRVAADASTT